MSTKHKIGLSSLHVGILALALAACGSNLATDDAGSTPFPNTNDAATVTPGADAATVTPGADAATVTPGADAGPVADPYVWVVIQDLEQKACTTNGPGADIDAVAKLDANGTPVGWGKNASFKANPLGNACDNPDCKGGNCKYAAISSTINKDTLIGYTNGPADAVVNDKTDDSGYFSLNAGTLSIQIADVTTGAILALKPGDFIAVYEVDQTYITSGAASASCSCLPEHYSVTLESEGQRLLPLTPVRLNPDNASCEALTATSTQGCGTTVFSVP